MTLDDKLKNFAIKSAFEADFDAYTEAGGEADVADTLDRKIKRRISRERAKPVLRRFTKIAAACAVLCVLTGGAAWLSYDISADAPVYSMASETDGGSLYIWFVCRDENTATPAITPKTAQNALSGCDLTDSFATDYVYIEYYGDNLVYEQSVLYAEGKTVIETGGRTVKNIVIGGYPAILVFDESGSEIFWRDDAYSYRLAGGISSDDAMKTAREMAN